MLQIDEIHCNMDTVHYKSAACFCIYMKQYLYLFVLGFIIFSHVCAFYHFYLLLLSWLAYNDNKES